MPRPNYVLQRVAGQIRELILAGYAVGERLPSTRQWARMHGVSERTVRRILAALVHEKLVLVRPRMHCIRAGEKAHIQKGRAPRKRPLKLGLISRLAANEFEGVPYRLFQEVCGRRGIEFQRIPHRLPIRPTAAHNKIDFTRIPWNRFDVGLFMEIQPLASVEPFLQKRLVLSVDGDNTSAGVDSVCFDNFDAGWRLAEHLFDLGHRRFAVTDEVNPPGWPSSTEWTTRRHGFEAALARLGGCIRPLWRMEIHQFFQTTAKESVPLRRLDMLRKAALAWAALPPAHRPTALYTPEASLLDGLEHFERHGLPIPRQLSLVTCAWKKPDTLRLGLRLTHAWLDPLALVNRTLDAAEELFFGRPQAPSCQLISRDGRPTKLFRVPILLEPGNSSVGPPL